MPTFSLMIAFISLNTWSYLVTLGAIAFCAVLFAIVGYDLRRAPRYLSNNWRWIALSAVLIIVAACAVMLAPTPPPGSHCVETHHVFGPLNMVLSCDSNQFMASAREPVSLLEYRSWNQARPLGVVAASLLTLLESNWTNKPGWLSYVFLNFVLLLIALMIFRRLNAAVTTTGAALVAVLSTFLVFNDVVKGFFWSAHTQMWNVLMPLISISLSYAFLRRPVRNWLFMTATGLLLGIGFLAYGSMVVCVAAAIVSIALGLWINRERPSWPTLIAKLSLFLLAFAIPVLTWITLVKRVAGTFFSPEAEIFRQFVWMLDSWRAGGIAALLSQARAFFYEFFVHFANVVWPAIVLLGIVLVIRFVAPHSLRETIKERSRILVAAGVTLAITAVFYSLMGFYRNRLEFNVVMPILVIAGVLLTSVVDRQPKKHAIVTVTLVGLVAFAFIISALVRVTWPY